MMWQWWLVFATSVVAFGVAVQNRMVLGALRQKLEGSPVRSNEEAPLPEPEQRRGVAVVYNPVKIDNFEEFSTLIAEASMAAGYGEVTWHETTKEDPGCGMAREALATGPAVVVVAGGDGTVRLVAGELAGTGIPLGIIPSGTGNLLARNLDLPMKVDLKDAINIALTGRRRRIDVGRISSTLPTPEESEAITRISDSAAPFVGEEPFVVISGMGFDADIMNTTGTTMKRKMGWGAYVVGGFRSLRRSKVKAAIDAGDGVHTLDVEAQSILFANCARLPGGFVLAPDARIDDGWLDIIVVDTRGGLIGWGDLVRRVSLQSIGVRKKVLPAVGRLDQRRMRSVTVSMRRPELIEADGDILGYAINVTASVERGALLVHVP